MPTVSGPMLVVGVFIGLAVGIVSGLVGVGGGIIAVPILLYLYGMNQHQAQGTSLAMLLPPTGLLAFMKYYKEGNANLALGLLIALGVFLGGYLGGQWAQSISDNTLRKVFAALMIVVAIRMFFEKS